MKKAFKKDKGNNGGTKRGEAEAHKGRKKEDWKGLSDVKGKKKKNEGGIHRGLRSKDQHKRVGQGRSVVVGQKGGIQIKKDKWKSFNEKEKGNLPRERIHFYKKCTWVPKRTEKTREGMSSSKIPSDRGKKGSRKARLLWG